MTIGEKIAKARKARKMTQEDLAELLSVSRQSVSKWESGAALPETEKIVRLCETLGIDCNYLLKENAEEEFSAVGAKEGVAEGGRSGEGDKNPLPCARSDGGESGKRPLAGGALAFVFLCILIGCLLVAAATLLFFLGSDRIAELIQGIAVMFFLGWGLIVLGIVAGLFLQKQ